MAETAFVNAATYDSASSDSAEVAKPVDTAEGDIMFALINRTGGKIEPNSTPEGWVTLGTDVGAFYDVRLYYKIAEAAEPGTYTWGWAAAGKTKISIATYRGGFNIDDPIDVVSNTAYEVSDTTIRAASMNVSEVNSNLIFAGYLFSATAASSTKPSEQNNDWVEDFDNWDTISDFLHTFCHCNWSGSGASGVMDAIGSGATTMKHAFAVALNVEGEEEEYIPKVIMF